MRSRLWQLYRQLQGRGLDRAQERRILSELDGPLVHPPLAVETRAPEVRPASLYAWADLLALQGASPPQSGYVAHIHSLDELLERDRQREADGFPRKIRVGRMIRPGRGGKEKIVVVPTTVEEKLLHDHRTDPDEAGGGSSGGTGEGEEGEVIGEEPVRPSETPGSGQAGQGEGSAHEIESSAYDLGRILTEKFQLPNLKDKGKKRSLTRYTYDLTDQNRGFGQVLDKKATLRRIVETNIALGRVPDVNHIDTTRFLIAPEDRVYRILSKEKDYESQALVFFLRDYSGSMAGKATELVVTQHVLIYSWLLYQYAHQVETRFILHDTEAREVSDFHSYYNFRVAGGTKVSAAYQMVNRIVEEEGLAKDYNIYVFHGTDGDDWDPNGNEAIPELKRMLRYANRVGITIAEHSHATSGATEVDNYLRSSGLLTQARELLRCDRMSEESDEARIIAGIKELIAE